MKHHALIFKNAWNNSTELEQIAKWRWHAHQWSQVFTSSSRSSFLILTHLSNPRQKRSKRRAKGKGRHERELTLTMYGKQPLYLNSDARNHQRTEDAFLIQKDNLQIPHWHSNWFPIPNVTKTQGSRLIPNYSRIAFTHLHTVIEWRDVHATYHTRQNKNSMPSQLKNITLVLWLPLTLCKV
jgi:hypothetical protein